MAAHGAQKLFRWVGGYGLATTGEVEIPPMQPRHFTPSGTSVMIFIPPPAQALVVPQLLHMKTAINLAEKLSTFAEHYSPRTVGDFNGHDLMVVKVQGPFPWHKHDDTDDFFLVLHGRMRIELRDRHIPLGPGELFVVPKGVEHRPVADEGEAHILLIEKRGTPNTGDPATAAPRIEI